MHTLQSRCALNVFGLLAQSTVVRTYENFEVTRTPKRKWNSLNGYGCQADDLEDDECMRLRKYVQTANTPEGDYVYITSAALFSNSFSTYNIELLEDTYDGN